MRIIITLISVLIPPLGLPLGIAGLYFDRKSWKWYVFCLAYAFGASAYCYETTGTSDITRYFEYIEGIKGVSFTNILNYGKYGSEGEALYVFNFICWIAGSLNDPHIVPFVSVFLVYYLSFRIYCEIGKDYEISSRDMIWGIFFLVMALNFFSLVNNIRNVLAYIIVGYAVYLDCYKRKRNIITLLLYVLPVFIHSSASVLIIIRLLLFLAKRGKIIGVGLALVLAPILEALRNLAENMTSGSLKYLRKAIFMAYNYFNDKSAVEWGLEAQASGTERLFKIAYIAIMIIMCAYFYFIIREMNKNKDTRATSYFTFVFYIGLMGISCMPMLVPIYWRFSATMIALGGCVFPMSIKVQKKMVVARQVSWIALYALGALCMCLYIWRMNSGSSLPSVFIQPFYSSPFIKILLHLIQTIS